MGSSKVRLVFEHGKENEPYGKRAYWTMNRSKQKRCEGKTFFNVANSLKCHGDFLYQRSLEVPYSESMRLPWLLFGQHEPISGEMIIAFKSSIPSRWPQLW